MERNSEVNERNKSKNKRNKKRTKKAKCDEKTPRMLTQKKKVHLTEIGFIKL